MSSKLCTYCSTRIQCFEEKQHSNGEVWFLSEMKNTPHYGGMLENCLPVPGSPCHCAFCSGQFMAVQPWPWALFWGWNSFQLPPPRAGVTQGLSPRLLCKSRHWQMPPQSRQVLWRSCSLTSPFSSPMQLKVARAVGSSRGDLPKCGRSGRANTTTSRAVTSTHTHSPTRPRCSRWAVSPQSLWGPLRSELELWPLRIKEQQGLEYFPAALRPALLLAAHSYWGGLGFCHTTASLLI